MLDGIVVGPQVAFKDLRELLNTFQDEWHKHNHQDPTMVGGWRTFIVGDDPKDAFKRTMDTGGIHFDRYRQGGMQEKNVVPMPLEFREDTAAGWAIVGGYDDCLEGLRKCRDELGLTHVTCTFYNPPTDPATRLEWLASFGERVLKRL